MSVEGCLCELPCSLFWILPSGTGIPFEVNWKRSSTDETGEVLPRGGAAIPNLPNVPFDSATTPLSSGKVLKSYGSVDRS